MNDKFTVELMAVYAVLGGIIKKETGKNIKIMNVELFMTTAFERCFNQSKDNAIKGILSDLQELLQTKCVNQEDAEDVYELFMLKAEPIWNVLWGSHEGELKEPDYLMRVEADRFSPAHVCVVAEKVSYLQTELRSEREIEDWVYGLASDMIAEVEKNYRPTNTHTGKVRITMDGTNAQSNDVELYNILTGLSSQVHQVIQTELGTYPPDLVNPNMFKVDIIMNGYEGEDWSSVVDVTINSNPKWR